MTAIKAEISKCRAAIAQKRGAIQEAECAIGVVRVPDIFRSLPGSATLSWQSMRLDDPYRQVFCLWHELDSLYQNLDRLYLELGNAQDRRTRTRTQGTVGGGNADPTWGAHENLVHSNPNTSTLHILTSS